MIRVAIYGSGAMARLWASLIQSRPDMALVAVASPSRLHAERLALELGVDFYPSLTPLLEQAFDILLVCTLPADHHLSTKQALLAGKDVFVEKPLCLSLDQVSELRSIAVSQQRWLDVSYSLRYFSPFAQLLSLAEKGVLGRVQHLAWQRSEDLSMGWRGQRAFSGGYWFEVGWHELDLSLQLLAYSGYSMSEIAMFCSDWQLDQQSLFLQHDQQMLVSYLAGRSPPVRFGFRLQFTNLTLCSEQGFSASGLRILQAEPSLVEQFKYWQQDPYAAQLSQVISSWQKRESTVSMGHTLALSSLLASIPY